MDLPSLMPSEYAQYSDCESDQHLIEKLTKNSTDLMVFFEFAAADGTWSERHSTFMTAALEWFTTQFYHDRILFDWAKRVAEAFWEHLSILSPYLPLDLSIQTHKKVIQINSLLLSVRSDIFRDLIRTQNLMSEQRILVLNDLPYELLVQVSEYIITGAVADLWKEEQEKIIELLQLAARFDLNGLKEICEDILKRYINTDNVYDMIIKAHKERWLLLRMSCFQFLNDLGKGVRLSSPVQHRVDVSEKEVIPFAFEFLDFSEGALDVFVQLRLYITHLICSGTLPAEPMFSKVVNECPKLISLDLSRSIRYSERLTDIPPNLQEIDFSKCLWLTDDNLQKIIAYCKDVTRLTLHSNVQLTFRGWGELLKFYRLKALDISRCIQVNDDTFTLILKSGYQVVELSMEECKHVSEKGFFEIARNLPQLAILNVARTHVSDAALIDIATRCPFLRELNVTRCPSISDKGILQAVKVAVGLQKLNVEGCNLSDDALHKLATINPYLSLGV